MKTITTLSLQTWMAAVLALSSAAVCAQSTPPAQPTAPAASTDLTDAEVRRVDRDGSRVTLKHAEIKALDMPAMTMVFQVRDKLLLDKVQPGSKVRFKAISEGGKYVVTDLVVMP